MPSIATRFAAAIRAGRRRHTTSLNEQIRLAGLLQRRALAYSIGDMAMEAQLRRQILGSINLFDWDAATAH